MDFDDMRWMCREAGKSENGATLFHLTDESEDNYADSAVKSFDSFRDSGILCDVILMGDPALSSDTDDDNSNEVLQGHRCILAAGSNYLKAKFTISGSESNQEIIKIDGVSHKMLKKIIDFLYKGSCKVTKREILDMTVAAAMMEMPSLLDVCLDFMDMSNVFVIWSLADSYQVTNLLDCCFKFISSHLGVLLEQEEFYRLPASMVHTILKFPKINLGPKYNLHVLRDALRKWTVVNKEKFDQKQKLEIESYINCEKLNISFCNNSAGNLSDTRTSNEMSRVTEFPTCFSLIAVMGGLECARCLPEVPASAYIPCRQSNVIEVFDTLSLTWVGFHVHYWTYHWPIIARSVFPMGGMLYFLSMNRHETDPTLHRFEPVFSRWMKVRKVRKEEALVRLIYSSSRVRAVSEDGAEIFYSGSVRVKSAEEGKVAFKINVKENTVHELPGLPSPRYHHGAVVVNGDLFIIGGCSNTREAMASVIILGKGQTEWVEGSPMSSARAGHGVAVLGDYIYAVGGTAKAKNDGKLLETVERYHIRSNRWEEVPSMSCPRAFAGVVASGGCVFVFGGKLYKESSEDASPYNTLGTCEKFDPVTNSWTKLPSMKMRRCEMLTLIV